MFYEVSAPRAPGLQEAPGGSKSPQEAPGGSKRPAARCRRPQEAPEGPRSPQRPSLGPGTGSFIKASLIKPVIKEAAKPH